MTTEERDQFVREIAARVFAEERSGRPVDGSRLAWAASVLDRRHRATSNAVEKPEVEAA